MSGAARMILAVDADEKARWSSAATKAGISTAEYLRRAAAVYDPELTPEETELARTVIAEVNASVARMLVQLDEMLATLNDMNDPGHDARTRGRIMAELEADPPRLDFSVFADRTTAAA